MEIKLPHWAIGIEDDGVNTFIAFCYRVCELHGYDTQYYISRDDVSRMCNKVPQGLIEWLRSYPQIEDNVLLGDLLDSTIVFQIDTKKRAARRYGDKDVIEVTLKEERAQMVWMYLLGCLNTNFIGENKKTKIYKGNTFGMKQFNLTREAAEYIKVKERKAMREKYDDLK
jgi:hypothetical protein